MSSKTLTIIDVSAPGRLSPLAAAVIEHWPLAKRPPHLAISPEKIIADPAILDGAGAAWIILDGTAADELSEIIGLLQERHVPAMVTGEPGEHAIGSPYEDGVVHGPAAAPPAALCAVLRTLWSQAGVIRSLRTEMDFLRVHQGGLCDQVQKMDEELRLAAQLQREFLPATLPAMHGVDFCVLFRPAGYVSGDIYDVARLDENHISFFVADAVGHGVPAALLTMYIKRSLHTKEVDSASPKGYRLIPPDEALARLNHDMIAQQSGGKIRFATACYGLLNCKTLHLRFARAGHPFPLLLHADGSTRWLEPEGAMLGVFPEEKFETCETYLRPGDRMLIYSDGFEMAFPEAGQDKIANTQYTEEFKALAHGKMSDALAKMERKLDEQAGSLNQRDDLTVVCLGVNPTATGTPAAAISPARPAAAPVA